MQHKPLIICLSGLDPTGGAGIQADIETLFHAGCHCLPVVTTLTVQDTTNVFSSTPTDPELIGQQVRVLIQDLKVDAIKIGLLDNLVFLPVLAELLAEVRHKNPGIPVIADPILRAGGGFDFSSEKIVAAYRDLIVPLCTVLTPNTEELLSLCPGADNPYSAAARLLHTGCQHILLTGTHAASPDVINTLYSLPADSAQTQLIRRDWTWPRLPGSFHGSGCTLAAAVAANLALGLGIEDAADTAQTYTWQTLDKAVQPGAGQYLPNRGIGD
jgi:hydroxymethylpyrimidine/phosphomethylpyrimidine kinase